jgi:hypothetical protein
MNDPKIPSYPVVHVNVAGDHRNYPASDLEQTRAQVTAYAVAVATRLGRGVRMTTTDPDGEWTLGVYPDSEVVDLAPVPAKGRPAAKSGSTSRRTGTTARSEPALVRESVTVVIERTNESTVLRPRVTSEVLPPVGTPVATLRFSTGDTAIIGPPPPRSSAETPVR